MSSGRAAIYVLVTLRTSMQCLRGLRMTSVPGVRRIIVSMGAGLTAATTFVLPGSSKNESGDT